MRRALRQVPVVYAKLPEFVRTCSDMSQFWSFIQKTFPTYQERREFIWETFAPVIEYLEAKESSLDATPVSRCWRSSI